MNDPAVYGAWLAAAVAIIPAFLAYRRGRSADDRSIAVTELELAVRTLQDDNTKVRGRLEACEQGRERLWEENGKQQSQLRDQTIEINRLKAKVGELERDLGRS